MYPKFFQTMMGKSFFEFHVPKLIKVLEKIACELERYNNAQELKNQKENKDV